MLTPLRELFLRHSQFAAVWVPHRVKTDNAWPQHYAAPVEGNIAAVRLQQISRYEIVQITYLIILIRRTKILQNNLKLSFFKTSIT